MARRGVLATLVVTCVGLFTGFFREGSTGPLHSIQTAVGGLAGPLQSFADAAIQPARDGWHWTTSLVGARDRAAKYEAQARLLSEEIVAARNANIEAGIAKSLEGITSVLPPGYRPVEGAIRNRSQNNLFLYARLDVGSADGVVRNSPVVSPGAKGAGAARQPILIGLVTSTTGHTADIAFVTATGSRIGVQVQGGSAVGLLAADDGGNLSLSQVPREFPLRKAAIVLTSGYSAMDLDSLYPRGLSIGRVQDFGAGEPDAFQTVQVEPLVDVRQISRAIVLVPTSSEAKRRASGG